MVEVRLIFLSVDTIKKNIDNITGFIDNTSLKKAYSYKKENDFLLSLGSEYLKKKYIGEYTLSKYGKPISNNYFFSISHSFEYVGIAINNDYPIGLDIENMTQNIDGDVIYFCLSNYELTFLKENDFLSQFVSKESLAKAYGMGLLNEIKDIPSLPISGFTNYMGKKYYRQMGTMNDYYYSISLEGDDFIINVETLNNIEF